MWFLEDWDKELYQEGYATGQRWANRSARQGELRRLWRFYENLQPLNWDVWWQSEDRERQVIAIMAVIDPNSEDDWQAASEYWERIVQRSDTDAWEPEFANGFVEGALGIESADEDQPTEGTDHDPPSVLKTDQGKA